MWTDAKRGFAGTGASWLWARVAGDGTARIGVAVPLRCGIARVRAQVTPAADGSFSFVRRMRDRRGGFRRRHRVAMTGRFDGAGAAGTVSARLTLRRPGRAVRRCRTANAGWELRSPAPAGAPAPPRPGATYRGLTSQGGPAPRPFLFAVSADGTRIRTSIFTYTVACRRLSYTSNNVSPAAGIRPDGTFTVRESFAFRSPRLVERVKVRVEGRFSAGGAAGSLRVHSVVRSRRTGRVVDRCDTGPLTFAAQL